MDDLPHPDVLLGSIVSLGAANNQQRDIIQYIQHLKPKVYYPGHLTDVAQAGSALYQQAQLARHGVQHGLPQSEWPDFRLQIDPNDFLVPQVFNPSDQRWSKSRKAEDQVRSSAAELRSATGDHHDRGRGAGEADRTAPAASVRRAPPCEEHGAGGIERGERGDEAERAFADRDEIERVRQHVERSEATMTGATARGNDRGTLATRAAAASATVETVRAMRSGQRPDALPVRARQTRNAPMATPEASANGERTNRGPQACRRVVMAADQRHRSYGDRDARQSQRSWPFSEADRDQHRNGDRADSRDRRGPRSPGPLRGRSRAALPPFRRSRPHRLPKAADEGWRFSRKERQRERHQHQADALRYHGGGQGRRAARASPPRKSAVP